MVAPVEEFDRIAGFVDETNHFQFQAIGIREYNRRFDESDQKR